jgi:hypothetical protein
MGTRFSTQFRCMEAIGILGLLAMTLLAMPASAQNNCLQDEYKAAGNRQKLNCTANDVRVAKVINVRDLAGNKITECQPGNFSFIADFLVQTTSSSARSNIGLYFSLNDVNVQPTALTGSCSDNIISPPHTCPGGTAVCGSSSFEELDPGEPTSGSPIGCGDTSSNDPAVCLNSSNQVVACPAPAGGSTFPATQIVTVRIDNFPCTAPSGSNQLVLPNCTSWQVPGSTITCTSTAPNYPYSIAAIPGSPSKCNCDTIPLGVTVQSPQVAVTKACTTATTTGDTNASCDIALPSEGGAVTYTVRITNNSNFGDVVVKEICDDQYGTIFQASGYTPNCPAGTIGTKGTLGTTTCTGATVTKGSTYLCTFNATQAEDVTVTDKVTVRGVGSTGNPPPPFGPTDSSSVTVTSHEAPTTVSITKSLDSTKRACVTVRYNVDVKDTSATTSDETIHLSALSDNGFGDITSVHGDVLGTTCGVANGAGTLGGTLGAGTLPVTIPPDGHYICKFDAQFCGDLGTLNLPGGGTCSGISHTNSVTGTETGDEASDTVTESTNTLTVYECFTSTTSSTP